MLSTVLTAGLPSTLLTMLLGALLWVRLDTIWSEEHLGPWLSLLALAFGAGALAAVLHAVFMPADPAFTLAFAVAVLSALGWWAHHRGWRNGLT